MRIVALCLSIFLSSFILQDNSFKVDDLIKMAKMNSDEFENYILNKDFEFSKITDYSSFQVTIYKKENKIISKLITKDNNINRHSILYDTKSKAEYIRLKNSASLKGFEYVETTTNNFDEKETQHQIYTKGNVTLDFYTTDREKYLGYCIGLEIK